MDMVERMRVVVGAIRLHGGVYVTCYFARRFMDAYRTASSSRQTAQEQWSAPYPESPCAVGHSVCLAHGHPVGALATGDGLRKRDDVLASPARVARTRRVAAVIRAGIGPFAARRRHRLVAGRRRFLQHPCGFGGAKTGPNPTDRRKAGSKHHLLTDAQGIPLAFTLTGANAHDVTQLLPLVEAVPPVRGKAGRPRRRPASLQGDRAYDSEPHRNALREKRITPLLAKRNTEHGSGLGKSRWVVERTISWLHQFKRLRIRFERRDDIHEALCMLACACICFNFLTFC